MGQVENTKQDQLVRNYYNHLLIKTLSGHIFSTALFMGNYEGRRWRRKICWLFKHKWLDITDKSVKSAKKCSRCRARIIERKPVRMIKFRRYNNDILR